MTLDDDRRLTGDDQCSAVLPVYNPPGDRSFRLHKESGSYSQIYQPIMIDQAQTGNL